MASEKIDTKILEQLDSKELERILREKKRKEKKEYEERKQKYEAYRDKMIVEIMEEATKLHKDLKDFKQRTFVKLLKFKRYAMKYGDIKRSSKGGFGLRTKDGRYMVRIDRNLINEFDERAEMAVQLIQEFMRDKVYKRDRDIYEMIMQLLARNKRGDLNIARVWQLLQMKDKFDDPRWTRAMRLMEESYRNRPVSYGLSFYYKNAATEKDENLSLSLPNIPVEINDELKKILGNGKDNKNTDETNKDTAER